MKDEVAMRTTFPITVCFKSRRHVTRDQKRLPNAKILGRAVIFLLTLCFLFSDVTGAKEPTSAKPSLHDLSALPVASTRTLPPDTDWLIDNSSFIAKVCRAKTANTITLENGLVRRTFQLGPNCATVGLDNLVSGQAQLRAIRPEAIVTINGKRYEVGGLTGQRDLAYIRSEWLKQLKANPNAMQFVGFEVSEPEERLKWKRVRHHGPEVKWPPKGVRLRLDFEMPAVTESTKDKTGKTSPQAERPTVSVHYELYDGIPAMCKWITVKNRSSKPVMLDSFTSEILALVEKENWVELREGVSFPRSDCVHVETDFAFGGFNTENANKHVVHWRADPKFGTQVNYLKRSPCLLEVSPTYGPAQVIQPGETFQSFHTFIISYDSEDRERRSLSHRKLYRTVAPWVTENPIMMHMTNGRDMKAVRKAIDQSAEVGFEMVILSFGSGFQIENENPAYLAKWKEMARYARKKGVELGGYSLLSSRNVGKPHMIVSPPGQHPTHGRCPALTSEWGQGYFKRLTKFYQTSGFRLLEHDGSYPGDVDVTPRPPLQTGIKDSRWVQWRIISKFYAWCRGEGIYLNVPDYYFLNGQTKTGMGYREVNWSLPRAEQVLHTRQNIFDGTWRKTPSMGWMFVPLTQYHGGGAAATIEPLDAHLDHYRRMINSNFALGVQACFRGPRLYDTDRTRKMLKERVTWYKKYRDILESDLIHCRRADGRALDWMLHVNPKLKTKGMLVVFNPSKEKVKQTIRVNLYYTGLTDKATIHIGGGEPRVVKLNRKYEIDIPIEIEAEAMTWVVIK